MQDPVTEEDMGEYWPEVVKAGELRDRNAHLVEELESMGSNVELTMARIEHLMLFLFRHQKLTRGELAELMLDWEKGLNSQLQSLRDQRNDQLQMAQAAMRKRQREARLAKPAPKKLVLPPGVKSDG